MRNILKICTLFAAVSLCLFGAYTLKDQIYQFLPQQSIDREEIKQPEKSQSPSETEEKVIPKFQLPDLSANGKELTENLIFVHANGFVHGKTQYHDATVKPTVKYDNRERLYKYHVRIDKDSIISYDVSQEQDPTNPYVLAKDTPPIALTNHTWEYAIQPYIKAITDYVSQHQTPIVLVIECRYKTPNDTVAQYIDMKAFSQDDLGELCNFWVTVYNTDPQRQLNYTDGSWLTIPAESTGGDNNG